MFKKKLAVSPFVGYGQGIKTARYVNSYYNIVLNLDQGGIYDSTTRGTFFNDAKMFFPLLNIGGRVMYSFSPRIRVSGVFDYFHGLNDITDASFLYNKGSGTNDHCASQTGKGSYASYRLGLHYAFGKGVVTEVKKQKQTIQRNNIEHQRTSDSIASAAKFPRWYIGLGFGAHTSIFRFTEPSPIPGGGKSGHLRALHLDVMYAIGDRWMLESGVSLAAIVPPTYFSNVAGKIEAGMTIIPFRLNYIFHIVPDEIDLMLFAGYSQGIKSDQFEFGFLSPDVDAIGNYYGNVFFPLADIGIRFKVPLGRIHIGAAASYSHGFTKIYRIDVFDMRNVAGGYPKLIESKGSQLNFRLDAYYAIKRGK
ncbi:MAG: hypothetical protein WBP58_11070 [Chitinophagaceae bacterium]